MIYKPQPIDTSNIRLPKPILRLIEKLAESTHDTWAKQRMAEGWRYGPRRDDAKKEHPCLVAYAELPDAEKEYDRKTAGETLKAIMALGYRIEKGKVAGSNLKSKHRD